MRKIIVRKEKEQRDFSFSEGLERLRRDGWSDRAIEAVRREVTSVVFPDQKSQSESVFQEVFLFGSPLFQKMWWIDEESADVLEAQELLQRAMAYVEMPDELTGNIDETRCLLASFSSHLAPHAHFWKVFSKTVQKAFPRDEFSKKGGNERLKRQIHQFRYLISAQQAQWVRKHYQKEGMTDARALARYLSSQPCFSYSFRESSRLHNKAYIDKSGQPFERVYPDGKLQQSNFKILLGFHTEFILDREGHFLNELDPQKSSQNGIVNGASFNYGDKNSSANHASHTRYDVKAPGQWDPKFRRAAIDNKGKKFSAPKNDRGTHGYYSVKGFYAQSGKSVQKLVKEEIRKFKRQLKKPPLFTRIKSFFFNMRR